MNEHEQSAIALYAIAARDPSDFLEMIAEPGTSAEALVLLEQMLAADAELNALLLEPVRRELERRPKLGIATASSEPPTWIAHSSIADYAHLALRGRNTCNCIAIVEAMGPSKPEDKINGHEPDCVATNGALRAPHGLVTGDGPIPVPEALGPMPPAGTVGCDYYVSEVTPDTFKLSASPPSAWTFPPGFDADKANAELREQFKNPLPVVRVAPQTPEQRAAREVGPVTVTLAGPKVEAFRPGRAIRLTRDIGTHKAGEVVHPVSIVMHGGHTDAARQYVLEDGTHITDDATEELVTFDTETHAILPGQHAPTPFTVATMRKWSPEQTEECPVEDSLRGGFCESDAQLRARIESAIRFPHDWGRPELDDPETYREWQRAQAVLKPEFRKSWPEWRAEWIRQQPTPEDAATLRDGTPAEAIELLRRKFGGVAHGDVKPGKYRLEDILRESELSAAVRASNVQRCKDMIAKLGEDHPQILEYRRMIENGTLIAPELRDAFPASLPWNEGPHRYSNSPKACACGVDLDELEASGKLGHICSAIAMPGDVTCEGEWRDAIDVDGERDVARCKLKRNHDQACQPETVPRGYWPQVVSGEALERAAVKFTEATRKLADFERDSRHAPLIGILAARDEAARRRRYLRAATYDHVAALMRAEPGHHDPVVDELEEQAENLRKDVDSEQTTKR